MIRISEKADMASSSWCIVCIQKSGKSDPMICEQCRGYITTFYNCPDCGIEGQFTGYDIPEFCLCGYFWPDLNFLKEEQGARVDFHMEED